MPQNVRVNIKTAVNSKLIRREKRNGKDYIIVPSATLPDDVVMNGIKYPADEIAKGYHTLDRTFAPLGHPMIGNNFVSALEPEAINDYYVGAHNENVRREGGRVFMDKAIDVEVANRTERGRALLDAINKGEPIHTSTGVFLETEDSDDPGYSKIARNLMFDHDAFLIGEEGAATPSQGVGVFVNSEGTQALARGNKTPMLVVNSCCASPYDNDVEWSALNFIESVERAEKAKKTAGMLEKFVAMVQTLLSTGGEQPNASGVDKLNGNEGKTMPITEDDFNALKTKVDTLAANAEKIPQSVADAVTAAVAPLVDKVTQLETNNKAKEDADRADLVAKVVATGAFEEADLKELSTNALRNLAAKTTAANASATPLFAGNANQPGGEKSHWEGYDLACGEKE
jgi:hypothetical protein